LRRERSEWLEANGALRGRGLQEVCALDGGTGTGGTVVRWYGGTVVRVGLRRNGDAGNGRMMAHRPTHVNVGQAKPYQAPTDPGCRGFGRRDLLGYGRLPSQRAFWVNCSDPSGGGFRRLECCRGQPATRQSRFPRISASSTGLSGRDAISTAGCITPRVW
jgi:hypothetical protein